MNNYINVRIQAHNHQKTYNSIKHNLRIIASLSDDLTNKEKGIESDKDFNVDCTNYIYYNKDNLTNDYALEDINNANKRDIYNVINDSYKLYRKAHNEIYKKWNNNKNIRDRKSTWSEGVLTFSEKLKVDFEEGKITKEELMKVAIECVKDITQQYGESAKINYIVLHLQEKTPHFHFSFNNFDDKANSLTHINRDTNFLSNLQDIAFKHFNKAFNMDRGVKKDASLGNTQNYKTIAQFHRENITQLKDNSKQLEKDFQELKSIVEAKSEEYAKKHDLYLIESKKLDSKIEELSLKHQKADSEVKSLEDEIKLNKQQKEGIKKDTSLAAATRKEMYEHIDKCNKIKRAQRDVALKKKRQYKDSISSYKTQHNALTNELKTLNNEINTQKTILEQKRKQEEAYFNVSDYSKFNFSEKIEKLKNIYLNNAPMFGLFNNKQYYEDMQQELGELLTLPGRIRVLQEVLESKNKTINNYSNERENLIKLSEDLDSLNLKYKIKEVEIDTKKNQIQKLENDNNDLQDKVYSLESVIKDLIKIDEIEPEELEEDFRKMNLSVENKKLSAYDLFTKLNSLNIDSTLKEAFKKHINKHK